MTCAKCHERPVPVTSGRGRPRKFCDECSPRKVTPSTIQPAARVTALRPTDEQPPTTLAASTELDLRTAGRLHCPEGVLVLMLAREIDAGGHSATGLSSLSREFARALAAALPVDQAEQVDEDVTWNVG